VAFQGKISELILPIVLWEQRKKDEKKSERERERERESSDRILIMPNKTAGCSGNYIMNG